MLFRELRGAVHEHQQLDDALDVFQIAGCGLQSGEKIDGHGTRGSLTIHRRQVDAELTGPRLAIPPGDVTRQKNEIAAANKRHECRGWRDR
jgi:hypothetical protein